MGAPRGGFSSGGGSERIPDGFGAWRDGKHILGNRHARMEKELYGEEGDGAHQVSPDGQISPTSDCRLVLTIMTLYAPAVYRSQL